MEETLTVYMIVLSLYDVEVDALLFSAMLNTVRSYLHRDATHEQLAALTSLAMDFDPDKVCTHPFFRAFNVNDLDAMEERMIDFISDRSDRQLAMLKGEQS